MCLGLTLVLLLLGCDEIAIQRGAWNGLVLAHIPVSPWWSRHRGNLFRLSRGFTCQLRVCMIPCCTMCC